MRFLAFNILNGLTTGALLFFLASGLTVVFGLMRVLNLSHGVLFLLGGYVGLTVQRVTGSFALAAAGGFLAAGLVGLIIQQSFSRTLLGSSFNQVLLTLGVAFILNNLVLIIWEGAQARLEAPELLRQSVKFFGVTYPTYRLFLIVLAFIAGLTLWIFWERSRAGAIVRACVDDRAMAAAMGIRVDLIFVAVFSVGAALSGLAGVLGGPVLGLAIGLDFDVLLLAVVVVMVGGVGSLGGAFVGSMLIGLLDTFGKAYFPELSYFTLFLPVVLILLVRPTGLFGKVTFQ